MKSHHFEGYRKYQAMNTTTDLEAVVDNYQSHNKNDIRSFAVPAPSSWMVPLCKWIVNKYEPLDCVEGLDHNF